jgi:hypothetical protein
MQTEAVAHAMERGTHAGERRKFSEERIVGSTESRPTEN